MTGWPVCLQHRRWKETRVLPLPSQGIRWPYGVRSASGLSAGAEVDALAGGDGLAAVDFAGKFFGAVGEERGDFDGGGDLPVGVARDGDAGRLQPGGRTANLVVQAVGRLSCP